MAQITSSAGERVGAEPPRTKDLKSFRDFLHGGVPGANVHVVLLGFDTFDMPTLLQKVRKGFSYNTFVRFQRNTALPVESVMILVGIPRRTLTRRKGEGRFSPNESDRLVRASRLFGKALELFDGDTDAASTWLASPQRALGGAVPLEFANTEIGSREVEQLIGRLQHGVFA